MYGAYTGLAALGGGVLYAMFRVFWAYVRLRRNKQLRLKGLEELEKRTKLRWLVNAKVKEAKTQLVDYLREFPLAAGRERKRLIALGMTESQLVELAHIRDRLLDSNRWPSDDVWFEAFRSTFSRGSTATGPRQLLGKMDGWLAGVIRWTPLTAR